MNAVERHAWLADIGKATAWQAIPAAALMAERFSSSSHPAFISPSPDPRMTLFLFLSLVAYAVHRSARVALLAYGFYVLTVFLSGVA